MSGLFDREQLWHAISRAGYASRDKDWDGYVDTVVDAILALPPQPVQKTEETVGLRADLRECDAERKAWKSRALKAEALSRALKAKAALSLPREPGGDE